MKKYADTPTKETNKKNNVTMPLPLRPLFGLVETWFLLDYY